MSWLTAKQDLRIRLSDGPTDRLHWKKKCFGQSDGTNTRFKTFEFRRVTNFTVVTGVYVGGVLVGVDGVASDNLQSGEFELVVPPGQAVEVEATYYTQWFFDSELDDLLQQASNILISTPLYIGVVPGLQPAAIELAASRAYSKMASRWREYMSTVYKVENNPDADPKSPVASFLQQSKDCTAEATRLTKFFYTRQNQNLQPLFATLSGAVRQMP